MSDKGYVYILTNPSFREDWVKIGKSAREPNVRSKELDNTAVPLPFEVYATLRTSKYSVAEKNVHRNIDRLTNLRIRKGREFFNITPQQAYEIFEDVAELLDDAELNLCLNSVGSSFEKIGGKVSKTNKTTPRSQIGKTRGSSATFVDLGVPVGSKLVFKEDLRIFAYTVDDSKKIRLEDGTETTMSGAVKSIKNANNTATNSQAYQGSRFWLYEGQTIKALTADRSL